MESSNRRVGGIISLGTQLCKLLQEHTSVDQKLSQLVCALESIVNALNILSHVIAEDDRETKDRVLNERGIKEASTLLDKCNGNFRSITALVSSAEGRTVLAAVDEFIDRLEKLATNSTKDTEDVEVRLDVTVHIEQLSRPWKAAKIEKHLNDLDHLNLSLLLFLAVVDLAKKKKITAE